MTNAQKIIFPCFIGEFGHELFNWQAHLRKLSRSYSHVITYCRDRNTELYKDFSHEIITIDSESLPADLNSESSMVVLPKQFSNSENNSLFICPPTLPPTRKEWEECEPHPEYVPLGNKETKKTYDAVLHLRNRVHRQHGNDSLDWSLKLTERLSREYNICIIGATGGAVNPNDHGLNVPAFFDKNLRDLALICRSSKICVGVSSGPMHFSALCETPVCVWTNERGMKLHNRYKTTWNPFKVGVDYFPNRPSIEQILESVSLKQNNTT